MSELLIKKYNDWDPTNEAHCHGELYIHTPIMLCPFGLEQDNLGMKFLRLFFRKNQVSADFLHKCAIYQSKIGCTIVHHLYKDKEPYLRLCLSNHAEAYTPSKNELLINEVTIPHGISVIAIINFHFLFGSEISQIMVFIPKVRKDIKDAIIAYYYRPNGPAYHEAKTSYSVALKNL